MRNAHKATITAALITALALVAAAIIGKLDNTPAGATKQSNSVIVNESNVSGDVIGGSKN